jgi:hypothetical protein
LQISKAFFGQYIHYANFIHQTVRDTFLPRLTHMHPPASLLIPCVKITDRARGQFSWPKTRSRRVELSIR